MVHVPHPSDNMCKKQQSLKAYYCNKKKNYFANQIIFVDRVVRVGYPPKRFKPHFWFSRPDCPYTNSTDCHSDF